MEIDLDRMRAIIAARHSYYGSRDGIHHDTRWHPVKADFIGQQLTTASRVLDLGCGSGETLLNLSPCIQYGLGIDNDPDHLQLAEEAKQNRGIQNVEFLLLDYPRGADRLEDESFDLVMSMRGPLGDTSKQVQTAYKLLGPNGLLFCEEIAEQHQREKIAVFFPGEQEKPHSRRIDEMRVLFEQNGFDVRLTADIFTKWIFADIYAWVQYECNLRSWLGVPLPQPDDPRIPLFAERNTIATGEIETTHHVAWVAGVKR